MYEVAFLIVQAQCIAEMLHYKLYTQATKGRPDLLINDEEPPLPNSPGYQTLWPQFCSDAVDMLLVMGYWSKDDDDG